MIAILRTLLLYNKYHCGIIHCRLVPFNFSLTWLLHVAMISPVVTLPTQPYSRIRTDPRKTITLVQLNNLIQNVLTSVLSHPV